MRACIVCPPECIDAVPAPPASDGLRIVGWVTTRGDYSGRAALLDPDLLIVDLRTIPHRTDEVIGALRAALPRARQLVLGAPDALDAARAALAHGVEGYVSRDGSRTGLMFAVRTLATGGTYITGTARRAIPRPGGTGGESSEAGEDESDAVAV